MTHFNSRLHEFAIRANFIRIIYALP